MYCIYQITCLANGDYYIGRSFKVTQRFKRHITMLKNNQHNRHFQNVWNKYGEQSFLFEIIEVNQSIKENQDREQYFLDMFECPLNKSRQANGLALFGEDNGFYGRKHSEETLQKISESKKGQIYGPCPEERRQKISEANKGRVITQDQRAKISATLMGKSYATPESKLKVVENGRITREAKATHYLWYNRNSGEEFLGTVRMLREKYPNLHYGTLYAVSAGGKFTYKDWLCLCLLK